jgi:hypothetical protein
MKKKIRYMIEELPAANYANSLEKRKGAFEDIVVNIIKRRRKQKPIMSEIQDSPLNPIGGFPDAKVAI